MMKRNDALVATDSYDEIADEYYDDRHVTSRNFDKTAAVELAELSTRSLIASQGLVLDVGAGRGRTNEFLGIHPERVIQLDTSVKMLEVEPREACLARIWHRAEILPFLDKSFCCVTAFLCDPFIDRDFVGEAFRVLEHGGFLIGTLPSYEWGVALRPGLHINMASTRFINRQGHSVLLRSKLFTVEQLTDLLTHAGFPKHAISISARCLPKEVGTISNDIVVPAATLGKAPHELPILYTFIARR
jgi:SAM-dependent methyltransferase